jgi:hypothetical protein
MTGGKSGTGIGIADVGGLSRPAKGVVGGGYAEGGGDVASWTKGRVGMGGGGGGELASQNKGRTGIEGGVLKIYKRSDCPTHATYERTTAIYTTLLH